MNQTNFCNPNSDKQNYTDGHRPSMRATVLRWPCLVGIAIFLFLAVTGFAAYPPILAIDGGLYAVAQVSGTSGSYAKYSTDYGVLILSGSNGGPAAWGATEASALALLSEEAVWHNDYSQTIAPASDLEYVPTIAIPQLLVYYTPNPDGYSCLLFQGEERDLGLLGCATISGTYVFAYNQLSDGYFSISLCPASIPSQSPFYRYQAGAEPMIIDARSGWPPSNVTLIPSQISYHGNTLSVSSFTEGGTVWDWFTPCYWANIYYEGIKSDGVSHVYGEMHLYVTINGDPGQMWGNIDGDDVQVQWDPGTQTFSADSVSGLTISSGSPAYGPPNLEYSEKIVSFRFRDANGADVYYDDQKQTWAFVSSKGIICVITGGNYDLYKYNYITQVVSFVDGNPWPLNIAAVNAEKTGFLGMGGGVSVIVSGTSLWPVSGNVGGNVCFCSFMRSDGKLIGQFKYLGEYYSTDETGMVGNYCQFYCDLGCSPVYYVDTPNMVVDASLGWPESSVPAPQRFPSYVFVNGRWMHCDAVDPIYYWDYNEWGDCQYHGYDMIYSYSEPGGLSMKVYSAIDSNSVRSIRYEINSTTYYSIESAAAAGYVIEFIPDSTPQYGPSEVLWNGTTALFSYRYNDADVYATAVGGGTLPFQVVVYNNFNVTISGLNMAVSTGTYNASTYQFNVTGGTLLAQDASGDLIGTAPGLLIYSASDWTGSISLASGGYATGSSCSWGGQIYKFKLNDGTFAIKFIGIPQNTPFMIHMPNGSVSPYYRYTGGGVDFILDTSTQTNWPATNIWPEKLYVNGHYAAIDASSATTLNGGYVQEVTYRVQPGGESIIVSWYGDSGAVCGAYGSYGSFLGSWNGSTLFGSLPSGLTITTTPLTYTAKYGPPQIKWNGVELIYDPLASAASASNPQGADVYRDASGSGLIATVASNGSVALYQGDGSQLTGTYNGSTYQFTFSGQTVGSIQADTTSGLVLESPAGRGPAASEESSNQVLKATGNFDIQGNLLSMGNWVDTAGNSEPGLLVTFTNKTTSHPSLIGFEALRQSTDWMWSHASVDGGTSQNKVMYLDASNRLMLFAPASQTSGTSVQPTILLDPALTGTSQIKGTVKIPGTIIIQAQGDLDMGQFKTGSAPQ